MKERGGKRAARPGATRWFPPPLSTVTLCNISCRFDHTGDLEYFQATLLPQIESYIDYYADHFGDDADGKLDMFPAQVRRLWTFFTQARRFYSADARRVLIGACNRVLCRFDIPRPLSGCDCAVTVL